MILTFADAALERVAQCLRVKRQGGESAAKVLIDRYMSDDHGMLWDAVSEHSVAASLWGGSGLPFYTFCCLVEVGCAAGYIHPIGKSLRGPLETATKRFIAAEESHTEELVLLRSLLERLTIIEGPPPPNDPDAFHGFAAYLALNEAVWDDVDFHKLLDYSDEKWVEDKDAHFLITPKHFAEAVVSGQVDGIDATAAAAGLRALEYFRSLSEFDSRLTSVDGLFKKALRAARWSHSVNDLLARLVRWSRRMTGWASTIEQHEAALVGFVPMIEIQGRLGELGLVRPQRISIVAEPLGVPELMQLGRVGEAQRVIEGELGAFSLPVDEKRLSDYVRLCLDLAEAGANEAAATRLARVESQLSTATYWVNEARALLRQTRIVGRSAVLAESVGTSVEATLTPTESSAIQPQYLRASSGSS